MTTQEKNEMIEKIKITIIDLQGDILSETFTEIEMKPLKLDLESLKVVLGHLITLQSC
tara:strand:- start:485 stop:658 length:174 start_codon:yes stop_codon:yes gene_type:complete